MIEEKIRVVVDTNLWISLLIGGRLGNLLDLLVSPELELISTKLLRDEIINVAQRPKFRKYFSEEMVSALKEWMDDVMTILPRPTCSMACGAVWV